MAYRFILGMLLPLSTLRWVYSQRVASLVFALNIFICLVVLVRQFIQFVSFIGVGADWLVGKAILVELWLSCVLLDFDCTCASICKANGLSSDRRHWVHWLPIWCLVFLIVSLLRWFLLVVGLFSGTQVFVSVVRSCIAKSLSYLLGVLGIVLILIDVNHLLVLVLAL